MNPTITHLRELLSKGTPGPWRHGRRAPVVCNATGEPILWDDTICSDTDPNVDLVVAAINALPTLLDRLAKLERAFTLARIMSAADISRGHARDCPYDDPRGRCDCEWTEYIHAQHDFAALANGEEP